jgi:hypothetical protein
MPLNTERKIKFKVKFSAFWSFTLYLGVSTMLKAKRASCVRLERSKRGGKVFMCEVKIFLMWHERASGGEKYIQFKWVSWAMTND